MEDEDLLVGQQFLGIAGVSIQLVQRPRPDNREKRRQDGPANIHDVSEQEVACHEADVLTHCDCQDEECHRHICTLHYPLESPDGGKLNGVVEEDIAIQDELGLVRHLDVGLRNQPVDHEFSACY